MLDNRLYCKMFANCLSNSFCVKTFTPRELTQNAAVENWTIRTLSLIYILCAVFQRYSGRANSASRPGSHRNIKPLLQTLPQNHFTCAVCSVSCVSVFASALECPDGVAAIGVGVAIVGASTTFVYV